MAARIIELFRRTGAGVIVGTTDDAKLVGVGAGLFLQFKTSAIRLAGVTPVEFPETIGRQQMFV
jgi:hypothetical protein